MSNKELADWYTTEVMRTWDTSPPKRDRVMHALGGLVGEVTEFFDKFCSDDEAGDLLYYYYAANKELGLGCIDEQVWEVQGRYKFRRGHDELEVHRAVGRVVELVKKQQYHNKDVSKFLPYRMIDVQIALLKCFNSPVEEIKQLNKAKLRKRYPDGFSFEKRCDSCGGKIDAEYKSNKCISCDHGGEDAKA